VCVPKGVDGAGAAQVSARQARLHARRRPGQAEGQDLPHRAPGYFDRFDTIACIAAVEIALAAQGYVHKLGEGGAHRHRAAARLAPRGDRGAKILVTDGSRRRASRSSSARPASRWSTRRAQARAAARGGRRRRRADHPQRDAGDRRGDRRGQAARGGRVARGSASTTSTSAQRPRAASSS
jgi:hypothetical protein